MIDLNTGFAAAIVGFAAVAVFTPTARAPANRGAVPLVMAVELKPAAVTGGQKSTATVTLDQPAGPNGVTLDVVSSNPSVTSMPAQISFAPHAQSTQFTVNTQPVSSETNVAIKVGAGTQTPVVATLTVRAPVLTAFTAAGNTVTGGLPISATVTLSGPAPSGGVTVNLSANNLAVAPPASVTVPANSSSLAFGIPTTAVNLQTTVTVSASTAGGVSPSGSGSSSTFPVQLSIVVVRVALSQITFPATALRAGHSIVGNVHINAPAPSAGVQVGVQSAQLVVTPQIITIPANSTTQSFTVSASCCQPRAASVEAFAGTTSQVSQALPVSGYRARLTNVSPFFQRHGQPFEVTVRLDTLAPPGGVPVAIESSGAQGPVNSVIVPGGSVTGSGLIPKPTVAAIQAITWSVPGASVLDGVVLPAITYLAPPEIADFTIGGTSVIGGQVLSPNRARIAGVAPSPGVDVLVSATPGTVTVATGTSARVPPINNEATFDLVFSPVAAPTSVTVTAKTYDRPEAETRTATITVLPPSLTQIVFADNTMFHGTAGSATVTLNFPAPTGGALVTLSASPSNAVTIPASITIPAGQTSAIIPLIAGPNPRTVTITATYQGNSVARVLTIT
jgi:hypothetical protein